MIELTESIGLMTVTHKVSATYIYTGGLSRGS